LGLQRLLLPTRRDLRPHDAIKILFQWQNIHHLYIVSLRQNFNLPSVGPILVAKRASRFELQGGPYILRAQHQMPLTCSELSVALKVTMEGFRCKSGSTENNGRLHAQPDANHVSNRRRGDNWWHGVLLDVFVYLIQKK